MRKIAVLVLAALPVFAVAQKPEDQVKQLKQENAMLRIQVTGLQNSLFQVQAQEAGKSIADEHKKAIADLEALNPGKKWDEQQGKLVDKGISQVMPAGHKGEAYDYPQVKANGPVK